MKHSWETAGEIAGVAAAKWLKMKENLVATANRNREKMDGTTGPVKQLIAEADVVFCVWSDSREADGVGTLLIKGRRTLGALVSKSETQSVVIEALPCDSAEMAAAALLSFGEGLYFVSDRREIAGRPAVSDGDSLTVGAERIRILGVDTPEIACQCERECRAARDAKAFTEKAISSGRVEIERTGRDRYGRTLARVYVDGNDLAALIIAAGHGRPYTGERRQSWCP